MKNTYFLIILLFTSTFVFEAFAKEGKKEDKAATKLEEELEGKVEKVVPGVIASYGTMQHSVSVKSSSTGVAGEKSVSPIKARITPLNDKMCEVNVRNSSAEKAYSVRIMLKSNDEAGATLTKKSFSAKLKPSGDVKKEIKCVKTGGVSVTLKSGKEA